MRDLSGLSNEQVKALQERGKVNSYSDNDTGRLLTMILGHVFYLPYLLIWFAVLALFLYERYVDGVFVSIILLFNTIENVIQEVSARNSLKKISVISKRPVKVVRDQQLQKIMPEEIVLGDLLLIESGNYLFVDGEVVKPDNVLIDESVITGESDYVSKKRGDQLLSGSFVVTGSGYYRATKVGKDSYINKLTVEAKRYVNHLSPLQKNIEKIVKFMTVVSLLTIGFLFLGNNFLLQLSRVELINATISVLISVIPQGVIIMVNVALVLGVYRMYKQKILVQKSSAIEALSAIDVLCFDKTGTITENKLKVDKFQVVSGNYGMTEGEVISLIKLYCEHTIEKNKTVLAISRYLEDSDAAEAKVIDQLPFNSRDKVSAMDVSYFGKQYRIMLSSVDMAAPKLSSDREREILLSFEKKQSERAMRNLTFTIKSIVDSHANQKWKIQTESGFQLLAKVSLKDTLRPGAAEVLREFKRTGVKPVVITGDSKKTVIAILKQLNIGFLDRAVTGSELNAMTGVQRRKAILSHDVFAAVSPEQKSEIVSIYQEQDQTVGMVGDGVNDALAIKQANLGISLSAGAGVSRDISDVVLLDNNLARLLDVVKEGKSIVYSTLRSAKVLLIKNFYIAWVILGTIFLQLSFVVNPRTLFLLAFLNGNFPSLDFVASKHTNYDGDRFLPDLLKFTIIGSVSFTIVTLAFMLYRQSQGIGPIELASDTIALMSFLGVINYLIIAQDSFNLLKLRFTVRRIGVILLIILSYLTAVLIPIFSDFFMLYLPTARVGIAIAISGVVYFALLAISSKVGDKLVYG